MKINNRRSGPVCLVLGVLLFGGFALCADANKSLKKALQAEIRASGAKVGLAFKDLENGRTLFIRKNKLVHAASTMKVAVMIEVYRQAASGKFGIDDRLPVRNEFRSIIDGSPFLLSEQDDSDPEIYRMIGQEVSVRELVERMITISSNVATNILVDLVGARNITATLRRLGIRRMAVLRGVEDNKAYARGLNNRTTPYDLMEVLEAVVSERAASREACREMLEILTRQKFREGIPTGVPDGVRVGNKTGSFTGVDHDAAIVFPPGRRPYLLVILTGGWKDGQDGKKLLARLSQIVYDQAIKNPQGN
jgi:beta-lactamase class A